MPLMFALRRIRRLVAGITPAPVRRRLAPVYRNARFRISTHAGRSPVVYFGIHGLFGTYRGRLVTADTEIVIEGAPRVASTWCVDALRVAQQREVRIATHTHVPANVLRAVRLGIPVLVIIREPRSTVRSMLVRDRDLTIDSALGRYLHFYRAIEPVIDEVIIADFTQVTADFGEVIECINSRFATDFIAYRNTPANAQAVAECLDHRDRLLGADALRSYLPNKDKNRAKANIRLDERNRLLGPCEALYERLSPALAPATRHSC